MAKKRGQPDRPQPELATAVFCENIVEDKGNVVSCIRIVDTINVGIPESAPPDVPSENHPVLVNTKALISFKKFGSRRKKFDVQLELEAPSGNVETLRRHHMEFPLGPLAGKNLILNLTLGVTKPGLLLLHVKVDGEVRAVMPLQVNINRVPDPTPH